MASNRGQLEIAKAALAKIAVGPTWIGRLDPVKSLAEAQRIAQEALDEMGEGDEQRL